MSTWERPPLQFCSNCGLPIWDYDPTGLCALCSDDLACGTPKMAPDEWPRGWRISMARALAFEFRPPRQPLRIDMVKLQRLARAVNTGQLTGDGVPATPSTVLCGEDV